MDGISPQLWALFGAIASTLLGVAGVLARMVLKSHESTLKKVEHLEEDKDKTNEKITELTGKVAKMEGEKAGQEMALEKTIKGVVELINKQKND